MKKSVCLFLAVMFISVSLLVGCGSSADSAPETLEGTTWELTQYVIDGQDVLPQITDISTPIVAFENGMFIITVMGETNSIEYTYNYENGKLTIDGYSVDVNGSTIQIKDGNNSMTLTKK